jgi:hypothetical protein
MNNNNQLEENNYLSASDLQPYIFDITGNLLTNTTSIYSVTTTANSGYQKLTNSVSKQIEEFQNSELGALFGDAIKESDIWILATSREGNTLNNKTDARYVFSKLKNSYIKDIESGSNNAIEYRDTAPFNQGSGDNFDNSVYVMLFKTNDPSIMFNEGNYIIVALDSIEAITTYTVNESVSDITQYVTGNGNNAELVKDRVTINTSSDSLVQVVPLVSTSNEFTGITA